MSLPRYGAYKDSGVDWLGRIPEHWDTLRSRRMFAVRSEPALESDRMLTASQKHGVLFQADFVELEGRRVVEVIMGKESLKHVEPDDFIISMRSFQGGIEWCKLRGSTSFHYVMLRPIKCVWPPYFAHLLKSSIYIQALRRTTDLIRDGQELRFSNFAQVDLPIVPMQEQKAIASFLDNETARIDALIAEQEKLIALLTEKRQATISHAVTRGLNPGVAMKDSGHTWLGDVPEHWEVKPLGSVCMTISYGFTNPMPTVDEGPFMLTANDISMGRVNYETARRTSVEAFQRDLTEKSRPKALDVLVTKDGTLGRVALFDGAEACINQSVACLRVDAQLSLASFVAVALAGGVYQDQMVFDAGGTTIKHIYISRLGKMPIAVPPLVEQRSIVAHLDREHARLNSLAMDASRAVVLFRERRSALIAAAVTGQIDVRPPTQTA